MINADSHQQRQHDGVAVMRCYRPTRIERELLTQVFDLVQRGSAVNSMKTTLGPMRVEAVREGGATLLPSEPSRLGSLAQPHELERAA